MSLHIVEPGKVHHTTSAKHHTERVPSRHEINRAFAKVIAHLTGAACDQCEEEIQLLEKHLCTQRN